MVILIDHDLTFKNSLGYVMDCVGQHFFSMAYYLATNDHG